MIHFFVRYQTFSAPMHTQTDNVEKHETWASAKRRRNEVFQFRTTRRCWVERIDIRASIEGWSMEMSKERWGAIMSRNEPERLRIKPGAPLNTNVRCVGCQPAEVACS